MDTVNGKKVKLVYLDYNKDSSGNLLQEGDVVIYASNASYSSFSLKRILKLTLDKCGTEFLGLRLDNGQYTSLGFSVNTLKITADFLKLHSKMVIT